MRAFALCLLGLASGAVLAQGALDLRLPSDRSARTDASCRVCGEIRSIREVSAGMTTAAPNPARTTAASGANDWAVVGAAVYLPTGTGTSESPHLGAVGTPEMVERFNANAYEIRIRMDTGEDQTVQRRDGVLFRVGDRVTLSGGMLRKL